VTIPNGATVTLNTDATLNGKLTLNGNIDASAAGKTLTLGPNAALYGAGDIIGAVQRIAPALGTALVFNNANTAITFWGSTPASIKVTLVKGKPASYGSYVARRYTLTPTGAFGFATLKLAYKTSEFYNIASESALKLYRFDTLTNKWVLQGGTADIVYHTVTLNNVSQFSTWTFFTSTPTYKIFIPKVRK
jgi:hypothetical protein